jgi:hypothetical protein
MTRATAGKSLGGRQLSAQKTKRSVSPSRETIIQKNSIGEMQSLPMRPRRMLEPNADGIGHKQSKAKGVTLIRRARLKRYSEGQVWACFAYGVKGYFHYPEEEEEKKRLQNLHLRRRMRQGKLPWCWNGCHACTRIKKENW